ncbi:MAG: hypothetical protein Q7J47_03195 [Azoarcus sp.]|nr:hypothetical protein [Azoarcus sp.]
MQPRPQIPIPLADQVAAIAACWAELKRTTPATRRASVNHRTVRHMKDRAAALEVLRTAPGQWHTAAEVEAALLKQGLKVSSLSIGQYLACYARENTIERRLDKVARYRFGGAQ